MVEASRTPGSESGGPARYGLLPPALRRDLTDLNGQYLRLALDGPALADARFRGAEVARRHLRAADAATLSRIAGAPFALFRVHPLAAGTLAADDGDVDPARSGPSPGWAARCASFTHQAAFFARQLADARPLASLLLLNLTSDDRALLVGLSPSQLARLAERPATIRPRWPDHDLFWSTLENAARRESAGALQWAYCRGLCLLAADEACADGVPATVPRPRR